MSSDTPNIKINVDLNSLRTSGAGIKTFFQNIRQHIGKTIITAKLLNKTLAGVGTTSGINALLRKTDRLHKKMRQIVLLVRILKKEFSKVGSGTTNIRAALNVGNKNIGKGVAGLKHFQRELDKIHLKQKRNNKSAAPKKNNILGKVQGLRETGFAFRDAGRQALFFAGAVTAAFAVVLREFARFEQAAQDARSVISELLPSEGPAAEVAFQGLKDTILDLGENTEFTSTQVAGLAKELGLAGFSADEISASLKGVISLASATNTELTQTGLIAVNITRAFGKNASGINQIADTLTATATNSAVRLEELGESFKLGAPIAASYGQSVEDVATVLGVLGNAGVRSSRAGTAISRFMSELTEKKGDLSEALAEVGLQYEDVLDPTKFKLTEIIANLTALKDASVIDTSFIFENFDQRSARAVATAVNQGTQAFVDLGAKISGSAGLARSVRDLRIDTVAGDFKLLTSAASAFAVEAGEVLGPLLRNIVNTITKWIKAGKEFVEENKRLVASLGRIGAMVILVTGILGSLFAAIGLIVAIMAAFQIAAVIVAGSIWPIITGLAIMALVIGAAVGAFYKLKASTTEVKEGMEVLTQAEVDYQRANERTQKVIKATANSIRDYSANLESLENLTSLNTVSLKAFQENFEKSGTTNPFDTGVIDELKNVADEIKRKKEEIADVTADTPSFLSSIFSEAEGAQRTASFAQIDQLEDHVKQLEEQKESLDDLAERQKAVNDAWSHIGTLQESRVTLQNQVAAFNVDIARLKEFRAASSNPATRKQIQGWIDKQVEKRDDIIALLNAIVNIQQTTNSDSLPLFEAFQAATTKAERDDAFGKILDQVEKDDKLQEAVKGIVKKRRDVNAALKKLEDTGGNKREKSLAKIKSDAEASASIGQTLLESAKAEQIQIPRLLDTARNNLDALERSAQDDDRDRSIVRTKKEIAGLEKSLEDVNKDIALGQELIKESADREVVDASKINKETLEAEIKLLDTVALNRAKINGTLVEQVELTRKLGEEEIDRQVEDYVKENKDTVDLLAKSVKLRENLKVSLEDSIKSLLKIESIEKSILDIEKELNEEGQTAVQNDRDKVNEAFKKKFAAIEEARLAQTALLSDTTDVTERENIKKKIANLDVLETRLKQSQAGQLKDIVDSDKKKRKQFFREQELKKAKFAKDIDAELRIFEEVEREKQAEARESALESATEAEKKKALVNDEADLLRRVADERVAIAERVKKAEEADAKKDLKAQDNAKKVNGFAKARADLEGKIADKLVAQVNSIREAKKLIAFINKLQRGAAKAAERAGLRALASRRKLLALRVQREEVKAAGGDTTKLDNRIERQGVIDRVQQGTWANKDTRAGFTPDSLSGALDLAKAKAAQAAQQASQSNIPKTPGNMPPVPPVGGRAPLTAPPILNNNSKNVTIAEGAIQIAIAAGVPEDVAKKTADSLGKILKNILGPLG